MTQPQKRAKIVEPRVLKGFRDLFPTEALVKQQMLASLRTVFESFGYAPIETPHLEYTEVLMPQASEEISKQLFRFVDQGDRDVCLRFDLTVPFARFIAQHKNELGLPFKRYACGNVFRGERPSVGRYREFTQCDFDFVGIQSPLADCEVIELVAASLNALGLADFTININNRKIMDALAGAYAFADKIADVLRSVDKLHKVGAAEVTTELKAFGLSEAAITAVFALIEISQKHSGAELFVAVKKIAVPGEEFLAAINELELVFSLLSGLENTKQNVKIDFSIARGLGYYTGIVFETVLNALPEIGSVCSGGRYDNLVSSYANDKIPGVGGSVGLDRLITALLELGQVDQTQGVARVLVALFAEDLRSDVYKTASALREIGINTEVYPDAVKLGKQMQYAERRKIPFVLLHGQDEVNSGTFSVKNLKTGEQIKLANLSELVALLQK